jgi:hypothetical protein
LNATLKGLRSNHALTQPFQGSLEDTSLPRVGRKKRGLP